MYQYLYYIIAVLIIIVSIFVSSLYASENILNIWFAWFYTNIASPCFNGFTEEIRAKVFADLASLKSTGEKLVNNWRTFFKVIF